MAAPRNVTKFEVLAYLVLGIGVVVSALEYQRQSTLSSPAFVLLVQLFVLLVYVLLIWLIARKAKNWARWLFLFLFLLGLPFYIPNLSNMMSTNLIAGILSAVQMLIQGIALYFIFSGDANEWFRRTKRPARAQPVDST